MENGDEFLTRRRELAKIFCSNNGDGQKCKTTTKPLLQRSSADD
jgi:hypothetical protein